MFNYFSQFAQDFRGWKDSEEFPEVNPLTRDFLQHILRPDNPMKLWPHQEEAFLRCVYSYELLNNSELLLNIVTGGGKTAIIATVVAWLKMCHNIHKFILLCPNTIVRDRLEDDFRDAKVFRKFNLFPRGTEQYTNELGLHIMESGSSPSGILGNGILLGNIHQLYQTNTIGKRNLAFIMNYVNEIAVFNDEAHNSPAPEYDNVLFQLSGKTRFRLDTTATPDRADGKTPNTRMIMEYNISDAQSEVPPIIKNIVVYQPDISSVELTYTNPETGEKRRVDEMDDEFRKIEAGLTSTQWVTDPEPMRKQIQIALDRLEEQKRRANTIGDGKYRPLLFVVAICIKDAEEAKKVLEKEFGVKTLLVTEKSADWEREAARNLGKPGSPYEAVVSVLMLREGWDVPEVSVILLLRKFSSRVYGQQVVGRGLRLNLRGQDAQEICAIVDHKKLQHEWLWEMVNAKVREDIGELSLFGDEDLPPKRLKQEMVNADKLIDVPEPEEDESEFEFPNVVVEEKDYPGWEEILNRFVYSDEFEITDVKIRGIIEKFLDKDKFKKYKDGPNRRERIEFEEEELDHGELVEKLKHNVRDIASYLLAEEGIGSHELGYFYGVLMDHIKLKFLQGKSSGLANVSDIKDALRKTHLIIAHFLKRPGLVASIVKHKKGK